MNAPILQIFAPPLRVGEKRISTVDNDIAFFEQRRELINDSVNRRARLHHNHCFARTREGTDKFFH